MSVLEIKATQENWLPHILYKRPSTGSVQNHLGLSKGIQQDELTDAFNESD